MDNIAISVKFNSGIWVVGKYWGFHLRVFNLAVYLKFYIEKC